MFKPERLCDPAGFPVQLQFLGCFGRQAYIKTFTAPLIDSFPMFNCIL